MSDASTPTLDRLLAEGLVWTEESDFVGRAADGTIVSLGMVDRPDWTEDYLTERPTPDLW